jgi:hypothetical protein
MVFGHGSFLSDWLPVALLVGNLIVAERMKQFAASYGNRNFVSTFVTARHFRREPVESSLHPFCRYSL